MNLLSPPPPLIINNIGFPQVVLNLMAKKLLDLNLENDMKEIDKLRALHDLAGAIVTMPINIPGSPFAKGIKVSAHFSSVVIVFSIL